MDEVAWINGDEGQYAKVEEGQDVDYSLSANEQETVPAGGYRITGEDIALAPAREDIAPVGNLDTSDTTNIQTPIAKNAAGVFFDGLDSVAKDDIGPVDGVEDESSVGKIPSKDQLPTPNADTSKPSTRKALHQGIVDNVKSVFSEHGYDFDKALKNAKNLSTFATVDNTPQRVMEKALGYKEGGVLADLTVNKVAQNETEGIKWLNSFTDRKSGLLAQISKQYNIKPVSKESATAQVNK